MTDKQLEHMIAKLRADYAEQLPGTVVQMEDLWRRLVAAEIPSAKLTELARMAHSIAGSGATFGLPNVSRTARELEMFLDPFAGGEQLPASAAQATVTQLLAALRHAAAGH